MSFRLVSQSYRGFSYGRKFGVSVGSLCAPFSNSCTILCFYNTYLSNVYMIVFEYILVFRNEIWALQILFFYFVASISWQQSTYFTGPHETPRESVYVELKSLFAPYFAGKSHVGLWGHAPKPHKKPHKFGFLSIYLDIYSWICALYVNFGIAFDYLVY